MSNKSDEPVVFAKKWAKVIESMPEFRDEAEKASVEELKKMIVQAEGNIYNVEKEKEDDLKLNSAKELVKDLAAGYKEAIRAQKAKAQFCLFLLDGKGSI